MGRTITSVQGIPTLEIESASDINGLEIIDVRRPDEFIGELGHIEGAKLLTLGAELENALLKMDKDTPYLFICRSGVRSGEATTKALSLGLKNVYNFKGGMLLWNEKGFPTLR